MSSMEICPKLLTRHDVSSFRGRPGALRPPSSAAALLLPSRKSSPFSSLSPFLSLSPSSSSSYHSSSFSSSSPLSLSSPAAASSHAVASRATSTRPRHTLRRLYVSARPARLSLMSARAISSSGTEGGGSGSSGGGGGGGGSEEVYEGVYGPWKVEQQDVVEVLAYRAGLQSAAASLVLASLPAFLPADSPLSQSLSSSLDALFATGAVGLGVSLVLIHIYVTPIKRFLQTLFAVGAFGAAVIALNDGGDGSGGLVRHVLSHPSDIWAVGPLFAALTGLAFKEGLCYGKFEAAALVLVIPSLLLGHLSGLMSADVERVLLATWVVLFSVFALRKFTQPIKDDIGDKSVFMFKALPEGQQQRLLQELQRKQEAAARQHEQQQE